MHLTAETRRLTDTTADLLPLLRHQEVRRLGVWFVLETTCVVLPASNRGHGMHLTSKTPPADRHYS